MAILIKYWRYFALIGAILALFIWHKAECSKSFTEGYEKRDQEAREATEALRIKVQERVDSLEKQLTEAQEQRQVEIRTVDREVIKKVFINECPDTFDTYLRLRNAYARAAKGEPTELGVRPLQATSGEHGDKLE